MFKSPSFWRRGVLMRCLSTRFISSKSDYIAVSVGSSQVHLAVMDGNQAKVILKEKTQTLLSSKSLHGKIDDPSDFVSGFNRLAGRKFDDPVIQEEMKRVPYVIVGAPNGEAWVESSFGSLFPPQQMLSLLLSMCKEFADSYFGNPVSKAVITFPSKITNAQGMTMMKAGFDAGLDIQQGISEPVAAAISYGMNGKEEGRVIAVVDLGYRSFDVSILEVDSGGLQFKGPSKSDLFLGGQDFSLAICEYLVRELNIQEEEVDIDALPNLFEAAENAKVELSSKPEATITLPSIKVAGALEVITITRSKFESLVSDLIQRMKTQCASALKDAGITSKDVDEVLLVGGMARMETVQEVVRDIFGKSPSTGVEPDEAVALGAAAAVQLSTFCNKNWDFKK